MLGGEPYSDAATSRPVINNRVQAERRRREAAKQRKEEARARSEVTQKVSNPKTLKKMQQSKKLRKLLRTKDD